MFIPVYCADFLLAHRVVPGETIEFIELGVFGGEMRYRIKDLRQMVSYDDVCDLDSPIEAPLGCALMDDKTLSSIGFLVGPESIVMVRDGEKVLEHSVRSGDGQAFCGEAATILARWFADKRLIVVDRKQWRH